MKFVIVRCILLKFVIVRCIFLIVKGILVIVMTGVEIYSCDCDVIFLL